MLSKVTPPGVSATSAAAAASFLSFVSVTSIVLSVVAASVFLSVLDLAFLADVFVSEITLEALPSSSVLLVSSSANNSMPGLINNKDTNSGRVIRKNLVGDLGYKRFMLITNVVNEHSFR